MNIFESINKIMQEVPAIAKDKENTQQHFKFRSIDQVMNTVQPLLAKNKVFVVPQLIDLIREQKQTQKGGTLIYTIMKIKHIFYAEDGTYVEVITTGEAMDSGDKSCNKAMAVAYKYALFQIFCIPTEDDPDVESPEEILNDGELADKLVTDKEVQNLRKMLKGKTDEITARNLANIIKKYSKEKAEELMMTEYVDCIHRIQDIKNKQKESLKGVM